MVIRKVLDVRCMKGGISAMNKKPNHRNESKLFFNLLRILVFMKLLLSN